MAPSRPRLLALVSGSAWLLLAVVELMATALNHASLNIAILQAVGAMTISGFLSCLVLFWLYGELERTLRGLRLVGAVALACLIASAARSLFAVLLRYIGMAAFMGEPHLRWQAVCASALWGSGQLGLCSGLYYTVRYWIELQDQREKTLRATALAHQAQLQMLRYQLNPHFLFNTLNSIRAMVLEDPAKSRQMITRLADFLRYSLDGEGRETTVGGEIAALHGYLEIQHIRFEQKLKVTTEIDPRAEVIAIPSFVIHGLVENAIKYGMDTSAMPLQVLIRVSIEDGRMQILVRNTGRLVARDEPAPGAAVGTGTGIRNIVQRLELSFPGRYSFEIYEKDGWVSAEIDLKLETQPA
jgi:sensor histidine kinase YesM